MSMTSLPALALDANGFPRKHRYAQDAVAKDIYDFVNEEAPGVISYLTETDAKQLAERWISRYLLEVRS